MNNVFDLAEEIHDGACVALPAEQSYVSMAMVKALIARKVKDLHVVCLPVAGLAADMLIGAGCVRMIECAAVTLGEYGLAPRFCAAIESGELIIRESTCPAIHAALQASEKGNPFMPLRGLLGTDVLRVRKDWKVISNPFADGDDPIVLLPALRPDFAIFHAPLVDEFGDAWVGRRRELITLAHASKSSLITYEKLWDGKLIADGTMNPGVVPNLYIGGLAQAAGGANPVGMPGYYSADADEYARYAKLARTQEGFDAFMTDFLAGADREQTA